MAGLSQESKENFIKEQLARGTAMFNDGRQQLGLSVLMHLYVQAVNILGLRSLITQDVLLVLVEAFFTVEYDVDVSLKFEVLRLMAEEKMVRERFRYERDILGLLDDNALAYYRKHKISLEEQLEKDWLPKAEA